MLDSLQQLIENYGYVAIAIGCFFEGETALFLGALAARQGILEFPAVLVAGLVGTVIGDNAWFYLGRHLGQPFIARRKHWRERADYARRLLERYGAMFIIGLRFFYGLRSVTPFVIGAAHVSRLKFFVCDLIGTFIWMVVVGTVVLLLGAAVGDALAAMESRGGSTALILAGLAVFAVFAGLIAWRVRLEHRARGE